MFKNLFGKKAQRVPLDPDLLLKQATAKHKQGDYNEAIELLIEAYSAISTGSIIYPVDTFLRLPLYLQKAGRNDESWAEFNKLLVDGYPNQMDDSGVRLMEQSKIFDKMRLFLQREKRCEEAVVFGVMSMLSWVKGLFVQNRRDEIVSEFDKEGLEKVLKPLLKKAGVQHIFEPLESFVAGEVKNPSRISPAKAGDFVRGLINNG